MTLDDEVKYIKHVGPGRALDFARLGIRTVRDLLFTFPRDLRDRTRVATIRDAAENTDLSLAVQLNNVRERTGRNGLVFITAVGRDDTGGMEAVWFNAPWVFHSLRRHRRVLLYGRAQRSADGLLKMVNPQVEFLEPADPSLDQSADDPAGRSGGGGRELSVDSLHVGRLVPEYPCAGRLTQSIWRKVMDAALREALPELEEFYPPDYLEKHRLPARADAVGAMHFPRDNDEREQARRRLARDEALLMQLAVLAARRHLLNERPGRSFNLSADLDVRIRRLFPFRFTPAQDRAVGEIARDMRSPLPMHRLLQGDVGSGKTAVALYAMLAAIANGAQACVMAPTGLLARQHYATIQSLLANSDRNRVRIALLVGGLPVAERDALVGALAEGRVDLLVATHSAASERVRFRDLGLVVVDEQHKFGVRQRATLMDKGVRPDALVMTATPIPRSLALTVFGDLDVSVINELPPGRKGVRTRIIGPDQAAAAWAEVRDELARGRQAYVVCPRLKETEAPEADSLEDGESEAVRASDDEAILPGMDAAGGEDDGMMSAVTAFEILRTGELSGYRLGLVHGRMRRKEQEAVMAAFREGRIDVLVGTVVVEVGVDVSNATAMAVLHADRFGLAQLHQLRGRVGRGTEAGRFFLFSGVGGEDTAARLMALSRTSDGFEIAETDLALRGPGEFLGTRQHGLAGLKLLDLVHDIGLIHAARNEAGLLLGADPDLTGRTHLALRRELVRQHGPQWSKAARG